MDGFGSPYLKQDAYSFWTSPYPVQYTGFKLFYKNDRAPRTKAAGFEPELRPDHRWGAFRRLPLTEDEFARIAGNVAPYLR